MQGGGAGGCGEFVRYAHVFDRFFSSVRLASTYKPVFVSALVGASSWDSDDRLVGRRWIRDEEDGRIHNRT